jgi:flagellar basal body-associated protein FliL
MAQPPSDPNEDPQPQEQTSATAGKSSLFGKIKILLFVVLVITLECAAAYWCLPSAEETALLAAGTAEVAKEEVKLAEAQEAAKAENEQVEVDLGEFNVTAYQPVSNTTLRIDFHLFGTVAAAEQKEFMTSLEENLHRFRDQVIITMRSAEITDLTDAGLGLVKRKILDKTNRLFNKPLLQSIIFSDFAFIEQ